MLEITLTIYGFLGVLAIAAIVMYAPEEGMELVRFIVKFTIYCMKVLKKKIELRIAYYRLMNELKKA